MGFFPSANDFKAGKGVEKDAPRKTGIGRFFELVGRDMNGMFLANLLTCIGFAPVICLVYIGFLQNSLPVMLGSMADSFGLDARAAGLMGSVCFAGYLLGTLGAPLWMNRLNWRLLTVVSTPCTRFAIQPAAPLARGLPPLLLSPPPNPL